MRPRTHHAVGACIGLLILLSPLPELRAQNPGDSVFAGTRVYTINLRFPQKDYWDSLAYYYDLGTEQYIPAEVIIDDVVYDSVGVRFKGNSSFTHPNNKKSLRLGFDQYNSNLRWDGLKGIHLNNCWGDPTFMREKVYLDFCRDAAISAPRANYARVYLNDTLWGLYTLIEHVDKRFLKARYGDSGGDLFKAVDNFDPAGPGQKNFSDFAWYGNIDTAYTSRYEMKTDESTTAWPQLIAFLDTVHHGGDPASVLPLKVDLGALYKALATDNLFGNLDSYIGSGRNFYFYFHPVTGLLEWIIWDVGLSFGVFPGGVSNPETMNLMYLSSATDRPLAGKIFESPTLKNEYLLALCSLFNGYFSSARLFPRIDSIANIIRPYVNADPRKMYTIQQFETNISTTITADGGGGTRKPGLKSFINTRQNNVKTQLAALGIDCAVGIETGGIGNPIGIRIVEKFSESVQSNDIHHVLAAGRIHSQAGVV